MDKTKFLLKRLDSISEWTGRVFSWAIAPMCLLVVFEVITRRLFNAPTIWTFESIKQCYGLHFMIVAAYGLLYKSHVSVDIFHMRWSPRTQATVDMVCYIIFFFLFCGIVVAYGGGFAATSWSLKETTWSAWHPPLYPIKTVIPVTGVLLILQGISDFIKRFLFVTRGVKL